MKNQIIVDSIEAGERIDSFLAGKLTNYSRNHLSQNIKQGYILVNNQQIKPNYKVKAGDIIKYNIQEAKTISKPIGEAIPLDIIYENNDILVINKQPGIVVHPAAGHENGTLINAIINYFPDIISVVHDDSKAISKIRPGLVHRLDKDTSGIIMIAKNERSLHSLSRQIQNRTIKKKYIGVCYGWPKHNAGKLINYLGRHPKNRKIVADVGKEKGKEAILDYNVVNYYFDKKDQKISLIEFNLLTGRTHQIRIQSYLMGNPIIGDDTYYTKPSLSVSKHNTVKRQLLHAKTVSITMPGDNKPTTFEAKIPKDIIDFIDSLRVHNFS